MSTKTIAIVLGVIIVGVIGWDAWLALSGSTTISEAVWAWSKNTPILPFAGGLLCGHLWWRR